MEFSKDQYNRLLKKKDLEDFGNGLFTKQEMDGYSRVIQGQYKLIFKKLENIHNLIK